MTARPLINDPTTDKKDAALKAQRFKMLEDIARELAGDVSFPTCFDVALQLRNKLRDPDASLRDIARVVRLEPLVSAKILRVANSAAYNPMGKQVTEIEAALNRVGINLARTVALAVAMDQLLQSKGLADFADISQGLWTHTLQTTAAARVLARRLTRINPEDALLAGLVHDLGAFYMLYRAAQYEELRIRPDTVKYLIAQWHESIGESLLTALGLPEMIVEATRDHDQPRGFIATPRNLADIVYVANVMAGGIQEWSRLHDEGEALMGEYQTDTYLQLGEEIEAEYNELMNSLSGNA
ncbi:MAG TPA: HDOD domain-containing protein [Azospira sp.]|nr:HDOD domain-containing protein [Azospira sp.]